MDLLGGKEKYQGTKVLSYWLKPFSSDSFPIPLAYLIFLLDLLFRRGFGGHLYGNYNLVCGTSHPGPVTVSFFVCR